MTIEDAWAAGLFEGEGSITHSHGRPELSLKMTDKDVMDRFCAWAECNHVRETTQQQSHHKPCYRWRVGNQKDVTRLLEKMLPFFGERRAYKALNVFDYYECR